MKRPSTRRENTGYVVEVLCNAQDALADERAQFRADCAARAIRTAGDAEKHMLHIAVARAEVTVVRQKL